MGKFFKIGNVSIREGLTEKQFKKVYTEKAGMKKPDEAYLEYCKYFKVETKKEK